MPKDFWQENRWSSKKSFHFLLHKKPIILIFFKLFPLKKCDPAVIRTNTNPNVSNVEQTCILLFEFNCLCYFSLYPVFLYLYYTATKIIAIATDTYISATGQVNQEFSTQRTVCIKGILWLHSNSIEAVIAMDIQNGSVNTLTLSDQSSKQCSGCGLGRTLTNLWTF